jgi:opacity protein-like surface antigen
MKFKSIVIAATGLTLAAAGAAAAQTTAPSGGAFWSPSGFYGTLGYANLEAAEGPDTDLSAITGRIGARFGRYLGVEGELSGGLGNNTSTIGGDEVRTALQTQYAGYVVGFLPVTPQFEVLARVGYGGQQLHVTDETALVRGDNHYDSLNYGAGAQYFFDPKDAVRFDYTRYDAQAAGEPDSDVFSLSWVRRF